MTTEYVREMMHKRARFMVLELVRLGLQTGRTLRQLTRDMRAEVCRAWGYCHACHANRLHAVGACDSVQAHLDSLR